MNTQCTLLAGRNGPNGDIGAGHNVAACKHTRHIGFTCFFINLKGVPSVDIKSVIFTQEVQIRPLADGRDNGLGIDYIL